jgi:SAM-dependent methyltransferase
MSHQHWSSYWNTGAQTSLPTDFQNNYDGAIYDWWQQRVDSLPNNSAVLDVCTGNGAVALLMAEVAVQSNKTFQITAVDICKINTESILKNHASEITSQIKFISDCPLESINTYIQNQQAMIVSQFGLEYTDLTITAPLLYDLLSAEGELAFIAHSANSAIFETMATEDNIYKWLESIGVFDIIRQFNQQKISVNGLKNRIMTVVKNNQPDHTILRQPLFQSWQKTLSTLLKLPNLQVKNQMPQLREYLSQHIAAWQRAQDMVQVAKKLSHEDWVNPLLASNFVESEHKPLIYNKKYTVGHGYRFHK